MIAQDSEIGHMRQMIKDLTAEAHKWQRKYQNYVVYHNNIMEQLTAPEPEPINYNHFDMAIVAIQTVYPYFTRAMAVSKSRKRELSMCRHIAAHLVYNASEISLKSTATMFGNRDHSTVINSLRVVDDLCDVDKYFRANFEKIQDKFNELLRGE